MATYRKVQAKWCEACEIHPAQEVHHIMPQQFNGGHEEDNLIDLCKLCHKNVPYVSNRSEQYYYEAWHTGFQYYKDLGGKFFIDLAHGGLVAILHSKEWHKCESGNVISGFTKWWETKKTRQMLIRQFREFYHPFYNQGGMTRKRMINKFGSLNPSNIEINMAIARD